MDAAFGEDIFVLFGALFGSDFDLFLGGEFLFGVLDFFGGL